MTFRLLRPQTILSLCDGLGSWSQPYVDDGYDVIRAVESGFPEDHADAALVVLLDHLIEESPVLVIPDVATAYMKKLREELGP